jgi:hypothetical protein
MDTVRKVHPAAKLKTLPSETQEALWGFFAEDSKRTLAAAVDFADQELGIVTSIQRMSEWRGWYARNLAIDEAESDASELEAMLSKPGLALSPDAIAAISNAVFLNRASKTGDVETFVKVASIIQRAQELKASQAGHSDKMEVAQAKLKLQAMEAERKLKELEMKVKACEAKEAETKADLTNPQLNEQQRAARMRARFGVV